MVHMYVFVFVFCVLFTVHETVISPSICALYTLSMYIIIRVLAEVHVYMCAYRLAYSACIHVHV